MTPPQTRTLGANLDAKTVAEDVLSHPLQLSERPAWVRAEAWHRLRRSALEPQERRKAHRALLGRHWTVGAGAFVGLAAWLFMREPGLRSSGATRALNEPTRSTELRHDDPNGWREVDLGNVGRLLAAPGSSFRLPQPTPPPQSEYVVELDSGELCVQVSHRDPTIQGPFIVQTATLRAIAVGTRFCTFAGPSPESSWVVVEEGRVRVERMGTPTMLAGIGSLVRGTDPGPTSPSRPELVSHSTLPAGADTPKTGRGTSQCLSSQSTVAEENCLWRHAGRDDLGAQNALYLLGALARDENHDGLGALSIWQTYLQRFPHGVLVAETRWAMFDELVAERRYPEALSLSDDFLRASPAYFRVGELEISRGNLLLETLDRPRDAEQAYRHALTIESRPFLRERALFGLGSCQERAGQATEAQTTWKLYLHEFPQGVHAEEVVSRLGVARDR